MSCPTITQYLETLNHVQGLFRTLEGVEPDRDLYGEPLFWVGNFSVIFRVRIQGKPYALKCYIREPNHDSRLFDRLSRPFSEYVIPCRWLPEEVYVYDEYDQGSYYPVLLMEWVEGETLGRCVARFVQQEDRESLGELAQRFDRLAVWLLAQPFAHGDIKHDNVLVRADGRLCLIDFDGMYWPDFAGTRSSLIGSPAYQHPARNEYFYNKSIDDYPLAIIALSLHALQQEPALFARYNDKENLILNAAETAVGSSELLNRLERRWTEEGEGTLLALCRMLRSDTPAIEGLSRVLATLADTAISCEQEKRPPVDLPQKEGKSPKNKPRPVTTGRPLPKEPLAELVSADATTLLQTEKQIEGVDRLVVGEVDRFSAPTVDRTDEGALPRVAPPSSTVKVHASSTFHTSLARSEGDRMPSYEVIDPQEETCAVVRMHGRYGYADLCCGRLLLEPIYEMAAPYSEGVAAVRLGGRWQYIDPQGHCVIDAGHYDGADSFREGLARVRLGERYGFIDREGREVIPVRYVFATAFREGLSVVRVGDKYGYINRHGVMVIAAIYDSARHFRAGRAQVMQADRVFCIDKTGCRRPDATRGE